MPCAQIETEIVMAETPLTSMPISCEFIVGLVL